MHCLRMEPTGRIHALSHVPAVLERVCDVRHAGP